jgi:LacI family transcriptional regulator
LAITHVSDTKFGTTAHLIKPQGIETRQSTDILAIEDPHVAVAARFIREQACAGIQVSDVLQYVPYSRRVLDRRFLDSLGRTPHEEITRQRIDRVKQLLVETDLPLSVIASRVGFQHDEYMSVAFKKQVGLPPSNYRRSAGEHS